jgi:hypothetical protein
MRDPIVRMYETEQQASDAVRKLSNAGFPDDTIFLVTPRAGGADGSSEAISTAIMAGYVLRSHARVYAEGVKHGRSLVVIHAPFGHGALATHIVDSCGPVDSGLRLPQEPVHSWDEKTPLSSALALPVLWRNQPAPFSAFWGLPTLSRGRSMFFSTLFGELVSSKFTFSALLGLGLLSQNAAPLSSRLGLKTLSGKQGAWTTSFGLPLLTKGR